MARDRDWRRGRDRGRRPKAGPRLHPAENRVIRRCRAQAEQLGLFLLAENDRHPRPLRWSLFDSKTGAELLSFFPVTGRWRAGGDSGVCQWPDALRMAASRRNSLQARASG